MASRYWVGGTATWDATVGTKWAATSGGAGGQSVPTAADDVFFDANSGTGTVTLSATSCRSINCTGFTGTISHPTLTSVSIGDATAGAGNVALKLDSTMTYTLGGSSSKFTFASTNAAIQTITSAGKTLGALDLKGAGSYLQLQDALTINSGSTIAHSNGTLDTNGQTCSWGFYVSNNSNIRALTLGASSILLTGTSGNAWNTGTTTNYTLNAGTSTIKNNVANVTLAFGSMTYYTIDVSVTTITVSGAFSCTNFICQPAAGGGALVNLASSFACTGTLTLKCTDTASAGARGWITPSTTPGAVGPARVITLSNAPVLQNFDFTDITLSGTGAPYSGTNLGDGQGNTGITFATPRTLYWVGAGTGTGGWGTLARWATSSGGTVSVSHVPMAHDNVIFDANSGITAGQFIGVNRVLCKNVDFSAANLAFTWSQTLSPAVVMGNITLKSGMTISGSGQLALIGRGTQTITTNGATFTVTNGVQITAPSGSYTFQDTVNWACALTYGAGTLNFNDQAITLTSFIGTAANTRTLNMTSTTLTLTDTGTPITLSDIGLTLNAGTSTIVFTDTSASTKTLNFPNSKTLNNIQLSASSGAYIVQWAGASAGHLGVVNNWTIAAPTTVSWTSSQQTTFNGQLTTNATAANPITFNATTAGTQHTMRKTSGYINVNYINFSDSLATGGASFYAGPNSTNVSNTTGWIFSAVSLALTQSLQYAIRTPRPITKSLQYMVRNTARLNLVQFDGLTAYAQVPNSASDAIGASNSWTAVIRFRVPSLPASDGMLWCKAATSGAFPLFVQIQPGTGFLDIRMYDGTNTAASGVSGNWADNNYHRLVIVRDNTANNFSMYVDGVLKGTVSTSTLNAANLGNTFPYTFSAFPNPSNTGFSRYLAYYLAEAAVYTGTLSSTDVTNLESGIQPSNAAKFRLALSEGSGTTTADLSSNGNSATLTNATWLTALPLVKTLQYTIKRGVAVTKSLRYAIKLPSGSLTKQLKYQVKRNTALTKSLRYTIRRSLAATKSLTYDVRRIRSITKSLQYEIVTTTGITLSSQYAIKMFTRIPRILQYAVKRSIKPTKSLKYTIKKPKSLARSLQYAIVVSQPAMMLSMFYKIAPQSHIIPLIMRYKVKGTQSYFVKNVPDSTDNWIKGAPSDGSDFF